MLDQVVDLAEARFWIVLILGAVALTPIRHARMREWAWAAVNVGFLFLLLYRAQFLAVVVSLAAAWVWLNAAAHRTPRFVATLTLAAATAALFAIHKFPILSGGPAHATPLTITLNAIGFSYVSLRLVDALRAVSEGSHPPPSFAGTINYLVPFHMLAAGPIQSYAEFVTQPPVPAPLAVGDVLRSGERIARGLVKKFVLAYLLQRTLLTGFAIPGWYFFLEVQLFYVWLYLDFSAVSDIAVGVGGLLGVRTPENFNRPFAARNIINFWERWHISLSQFIRRNIYIPIQLSLMRRTGAKYALWCSSTAFMIAFGLCGLWHAGTLRFLLWGLMHGTALIVANLYRQALTTRLGAKRLRAYMADPRIRVMSTALTFEFVAFSLIVFQLPS